MKSASIQVAFALLLAPALSCYGLLAQGQDGNDGWAQFTRENTIRGTVTGSAAGGFEIKTVRGEPWRVLYGPNTRIVKNRQPAKAADVHTGDMLFVAGNPDSKKKQIGAAVLIDIDAAEVRSAKEGLGKTWSAGKVTAVSGTRISVQRIDGVADTILVDENTSFRQGHDSVTLAEVKPGEHVRAEGTVTGGSFTATTLHVFVENGHEPWLDADAEKH